MNVIYDKDKQKLPVFDWSKNLEDGAFEQAVNLSNHPCVVKRVCLMPDAHAGFGIPIGGVIATRDAVIPNAVGVDIGCSMSAYRTDIGREELTPEVLRKIIDDIREVIPTGTKHNKVKQKHWLLSDFEEDWMSTTICKQEFESAQYQLGTMGGGNHFIEIQNGSDGCIYFMIHSGSRNLGHKVGSYYNNLAEQLCKTWRHEDVVKNKLAFLPRGTKEFNAYCKEMNLCLDFAKANHEVMCNKLEAILNKYVSGSIEQPYYYTRHNYADIENHEGENLIIHRKGAVRARITDVCIIPGSQGTASYIVQGLGNDKSFCSASHGSGRVMSRTKARNELSLDKEQEKMKGIIHNMTSEKQLDEAPSAYKDIEEVIALEADLVKPIIKLTPLAVVKE